MEKADSRQEAVVSHDFYRDLIFNMPSFRTEEYIGNIYIYMYIRIYIYIERERERLRDNFSLLHAAASLASLRQ